MQTKHPSVLKEVSVLLPDLEMSKIKKNGSHFVIVCH